MIRPDSYHCKHTREPWLHALRKLHRRGWPDHEIADALSQLSREAIAILDANGWTRQRIRRLRCLSGGGSTWTRWQVWYCRHQLAIKARRRSTPIAMIDARKARLRAYQCDHGWEHLLPAYDDLKGEWLPGHELRPREVDILCLLRDHGPMTRAELAPHLGLRPHRQMLRSGPSITRRLCNKGLIQIVSRKKTTRYAHIPVYALRRIAD